MHTTDIITQQSRRNIEKMRTHAEITARYNLGCQQYKELKNNDKGDNREQLLMLYAELKAVGWILGKSEQTMVQDING